MAFGSVDDIFADMEAEIEEQKELKRRRSKVRSLLRELTALPHSPTEARKIDLIEELAEILVR